MRYIILDPDYGVFLGSYRDFEVDPRGVYLMLWSSNNPMGVHKAYSFTNKNKAQGYVDTMLKFRYPKCFVGSIPVDVGDRYLDVTHLIKHGYEPYTYDMMYHMPMQNYQVH
mgnify:CR=1 FL=1